MCDICTYYTRLTCMEKNNWINKLGLKIKKSRKPTVVEQISFPRMILTESHFYFYFLPQAVEREPRWQLQNSHDRHTEPSGQQR